MLCHKSEWNSAFTFIEGWSDWLKIEGNAAKLEVLRKHVEKGLLCGADSFVQRLGQKVGRVLENRPQGRPTKIEKG